MQPIRIPLIESDDDGKYFLPVRGVDPEELDGVEFRLKRERGILDVYCYSSGFNEGDDVEGRYIPVAIDEENSEAIDNLQVLQVVSPDDLNKEYLTENERDRITETFDD